MVDRATMPNSWHRTRAQRLGGTRLQLELHPSPYKAPRTCLVLPTLEAALMFQLQRSGLVRRTSPHHFSQDILFYVLSYFIPIWVKTLGTVNSRCIAVIIIVAFLIMALIIRTYVLNARESACVPIQYVPITHAWRELGWRGVGGDC